MKIFFNYNFWPESNQLCAAAKLLEENKEEPLVLEKFDRYSYYLVGSLVAWFPELGLINKTLQGLQQLEAGELQSLEVCENDVLAEITLEGVQISNLTDDSVTDQPEGRFTYQEVKTIFLKYKEFLEMPVSLDSTLEFDL